MEGKIVEDIKAECESGRVDNDGVRRLGPHNSRRRDLKPRPESEFLAFVVTSARPGEAVNLGNLTLRNEWDRWPSDIFL